MDNEEERIFNFLNESISDLDDNSGDEERNVPYYSGIDSDDTDKDPNYNPASSPSSAEHSSDEEDLQHPVQPIDTVAETIERVIADTNVSTDVQDNIARGQSVEPPRPNADYHVVCENVSLKGKNGHLWSNQPPANTTTRRTAVRNVVHIRQGPKDAAKNKTDPSDVLSLFFTDEMKDIITQHTNEAIGRKKDNYSKQTKTVSELSKEELNAFLGILILTAAQKDNHMPTKTLFNSEYCGERYKATMSCGRFEFLLEALRFDDQETRINRSKDDRLAPIREIWDLFISACRNNYKPGSYVTIDEQLLGFRGRCKFRMYIPNKPSKYGLKILMMCDSGTKYMIDAMPYLGKGTFPHGTPQGQFIVTELTRSIHGSNRNVTVDNWFTTVPLVTNLLAPPVNLTLVGTLRRDKPEIPPEMKDPGDRRIGSSMFCFDGPRTMVSYKTKKKKVVLLLSTLHDTPSINERSKKPDIIEFYNSTKGAVDTLDQMCGQMSCSRKTKRWPLCIFYGIINIMLVNSYVIYVSNKISAGEKPLKRREFATALHCELLRPWLQQRMTYQFLARPLRTSIASILGVELQDDTPRGPQPQGRKICGFCPAKKRRMTKYYCVRCTKAMCGEHQGQLCAECAK